MDQPEGIGGPVVILAPVGRDAAATAEVLKRAGFASVICPDLPDLLTALDREVDAAVVAEEAIFGKRSELLLEWIARQEPWSDMPFVILTSRQDRSDVLAWRQRLLVRLRNASLLERPLDAATLTSAVASAVRGRLRQYEMRAYVAERALVAERLEAVVAERTSELRVQMEERAKVEDVLRQSLKMEAVGQLTGGIAHDFNNLLTGISGSLELIGSRVAQGRFDHLDRYIAAAQASSRRAAALIHRLLAFSRRQTLDPKPIDANRLVEDMEDLIRRTVGPEIAVDVHASAGLWPILVDPNQLENAILNLCINARDAMPDGGQLTIETANTTLAADEARRRDLPPGDFVLVSVKDTGVGMEPAVAARAFDPFFTTKPLGQGTGLGLSMIYGFVRQSGGQARIYSEQRRGAMVHLYLPRHEGVAEPPANRATPLEAPRAMSGETVLVVDDEPTVRMLVREALSELGYHAIEAGDGAAGLQVLRSDRRVDLLVTDVGLPGGMNGRQLADAARLIRPGLKTLFITGYADKAAVGGASLEPGMQLLVKPFALEGLTNVIGTLIAEETSATSQQ